MTKSLQITRLIRCPQCQKSTRYDTANQFRPFCSERCKNVDIVGWAEGRYQIPSQAPLEEEARVPHSDGIDEDESEF